MYRREVWYKAGPCFNFSCDSSIKSKRAGSVSGSGTGPEDPGSRGPAVPDPETFPYECPAVHLYALFLNLNSLLVKRQINNPSPGTVTGGS